MNPLEAQIDGIVFEPTKGERGQRAKGWDLSIGCQVCGAPQFFYCRAVNGKRLYMSHADRRLAGKKLAVRRGLQETSRFWWRG